MRIRTSLSVIVRIAIWILLLGGGAVLSRRLDRLFFADFDPFSPWRVVFILFGIVLLALAFKAAAAGGRQLAESGRRHPDTPRLETDTLVTSGIYALMRHPMLFGLGLLPLGVAFLIGSPSFILIVAPAETLLIVFLVLTLEERECRKKFGQAYLDYAQKVPAVCFKRECLRLLFRDKS